MQVDEAGSSPPCGLRTVVQTERRFLHTNSLHRRKRGPPLEHDGRWAARNARRAEGNVRRRCNVANGGTRCRELLVSPKA